MPCCTNLVNHAKYILFAVDNIVVLKKLYFALSLLTVGPGSPWKPSGPSSPRIPFPPTGPIRPGRPTGPRFPLPPWAPGSPLSPTYRALIAQGENRAADQIKKKKVCSKCRPLQYSYHSQNKTNLLTIKTKSWSLSQSLELGCCFFFWQLWRFAWTFQNRNQMW